MIAIPFISRHTIKIDYRVREVTEDKCLELSERILIHNKQVNKYNSEKLRHLNTDSLEKSLLQAVKITEVIFAVLFIAIIGMLALSMPFSIVIPIIAVIVTLIGAAVVLVLTGALRIAILDLSNKRRDSSEAKNKLEQEQLDLKKEEEILHRMTMEEIKEFETDEEIRVGKRPSDEEKISRFLHTLRKGSQARKMQNAKKGLESDVSLPPVPPARRSKRVSKT